MTQANGIESLFLPRSSFLGKEPEYPRTYEAVLHESSAVAWFTITETFTPTDPSVKSVAFTVAGTWKVRRKDGALLLSLDGVPDVVSLVASANQTPHGHILITQRFNEDKDYVLLSSSQDGIRGTALLNNFTTEKVFKALVPPYSAKSQLYPKITAWDEATLTEIQVEAFGSRSGVCTPPTHAPLVKGERTRFLWKLVTPELKDGFEGGGYYTEFGNVLLHRRLRNNDIGFRRGVVLDHPESSAVHTVSMMDLKMLTGLEFVGTEFKLFDHAALQCLLANSVEIVKFLTAETKADEEALLNPITVQLEAPVFGIPLRTFTPYFTRSDGEKEAANCILIKDSFAAMGTLFTILLSTKSGQRFSIPLRVEQGFLKFKNPLLMLRKGTAVGADLSFPFSSGPLSDNVVDELVRIFTEVVEGTSLDQTLSQETRTESPMNEAPEALDVSKLTKAELRLLMFKAESVLRMKRVEAVRSAVAALRSNPWSPSNRLRPGHLNDITYMYDKLLGELTTSRNIFIDDYLERLEIALEIDS